MTTTELRALLTLLREFGVTDYAADGVSLRLGAARLVEQSLSDGPQPPKMLLPEPRTMPAQVVEAIKRMRPEYQALIGPVVADES